MSTLFLNFPEKDYLEGLSVSSREHQLLQMTDDIIFH